MAHNSLAPAFVKLRYTQTGITHVQTIPVQPSGTPTVGTEPNLVPASGGPIALSQFATDYMAVFRPLFPTTTAIEGMEFWYKPTPEADPIWIYDHPINLAGSSAQAVVLMSQLVVTFRTALGGILKCYLMEVMNTIPMNNRTPGASLTGVVLAYSNYVKGSTTCFLGRDNAKPMVPIFQSTKTNDALRKRRLLM